MDPDELHRKLLATFAEELAEQAPLLERELLGAERDPSTIGERMPVLLRIAHALKGAARAVALRPVEQLCHQAEGLLIAIRDGEAALDAGRMELLLRMADLLEAAASALRNGERIDEEALQHLAGAMALPAAAQRTAPPASTASPAGTTPPPPARPPGEPAEHAPPAPTLRLTTQVADSLVAWSGELLIVRARIERRAAELAPLRALAQSGHLAQRRHAALRHDRVDELAAPLAELAHSLDRLERDLVADTRALHRVSRALAEGIREVRMVPFSEATEGLERAVRDLARGAGKEVRLELRGGELRLDRAVAAGLRDPLLQLLRNSIDHGIEPPETRRALGKESVGLLSIGAELRGDRVAVSVSDDGRGIDFDAVREAAARAGIEAPARPGQAAGLLFHPGFSTRESASPTSGRGVGLDLVKRRIEALRGSISLRWREGAGSRLVLQVPLTLGTSRVLLVEAGGRQFALPGGAVERVARISRAAIHPLLGRETIDAGGAAIPLASLGDLLGLQRRELPGPAARLPVVVIAAADRRAAFAVDRLQGEMEVLVKSLGRRLQGIPYLSGAALLPAGTLAPILEVDALLDAAHRTEAGAGVATSFAAPAAARKSRLLLADDSLTTRALERSILEAAGYEVLVAADGVEAWGLLQERGADLLVADVEMPRMDGFTLTEAIRQSRRFRDLPVVLVTGLDSSADRARGLQAGANAYIVKSAFDQKGLLDTVAQLL